MWFSQQDCWNWNTNPSWSWFYRYAYTRMCSIWSWFYQFFFGQCCYLFLAISWWFPFNFNRIWTSCSLWKLNIQCNHWLSATLLKWCTDEDELYHSKSYTGFNIYLHYCRISGQFQFSGQFGWLYNWIFGDGQTSTLHNPHMFTAQVVHIMSHSPFRIYAVKSSSDYRCIRRSPVAAFNSNVQGCGPLSVQYANLSTDWIINAAGFEGGALQRVLYQIQLYYIIQLVHLMFHLQLQILWSNNVLLQNYITVFPLQPVILHL